MLHRSACVGHNLAMRGPTDAPEHTSPVPTVPAVRRGTVTVICGCMFSGKTTELLRRLSHAPSGSSVAFKHVIDQRYGANVVMSHDGKAWPAVKIASARCISVHVRRGIGIVAVDEAHFFGPDLADVVRDLADRGNDVIITSLDRDSWGRPFPIARQLGRIADEPIVKRAVCARCGGVADHTQRLTPIIDGDMVGGPESYEPRCRNCWAPPPQSPPP